ncbi:hypothetical protein ADK54_11575 [Streptomyces sp. WM6378]|nr:hypothetical protein ADK54_11575 [Streptomyces sp. WM6378]
MRIGPPLAVVGDRTEQQATVGAGLQFGGALVVQRGPRRLGERAVGRVRLGVVAGAVRPDVAAGVEHRAAGGLRHRNAFGELPQDFGQFSGQRPIGSGDRDPQDARVGAPHEQRQELLLGGGSGVHVVEGEGERRALAVAGVGEQEVDDPVAGGPDQALGEVPGALLVRGVVHQRGRRRADAACQFGDEVEQGGPVLVNQFRPDAQASGT